jgi:hypothetical protein
MPSLENDVRFMRPDDLIFFFRFYTAQNMYTKYKSKSKHIGPLMYSLTRNQNVRLQNSYLITFKVGCWTKIKKGGTFDFKRGPAGRPVYRALPPADATKWVLVLSTISSQFNGIKDHLIKSKITQKYPKF